MGLFFYTKKGSIISTMDLPTTEIIEPKVFAEVYKDAGITKIVTIEASGIAPALYTAQAMQVPMIFAKTR